MDNGLSHAPVRCRPDCAYFSAYTNTCDYTLLMYHSRGCPRDACTRFAPRSDGHVRPRVLYGPEEGLYVEVKEENGMRVPEPPAEPSEDPRYIAAGCGHEVYDGEDLFECEDGLTLCADCMEEKFSEMTLLERAELLGCEHTVVSFRRGAADCDNAYISEADDVPKARGAHFGYALETRHVPGLGD